MAKRQKTRIHKTKSGRFFDYSLLFIIIFLLCFGLVMLYSTSSYTAQLKFGSGSYYLNKQIFATILGLAGMAFVIWFGYERIEKLAFPIYVVSILSVLLVLTPLGYEANGARRWLNLGVTSVQPAEFVKLAVIIFLAFIISKTAGKISDWKNLVKIFVLILPAVAAVAVVTENLSTAIIIMGIAFIMLFVASPKYKPFLVIAGVAVVGILAFIMFGSGFRMTRIEVWKNPELYPQDGGFQVLQGLYAIGSGGIFGKGLGQSLQKMGFIPEAQNDMIFTIICEELGLFGAVCVILLFLFMLWRFMIIANNAPNLFSALLVVGVMGHIALQVILNIAVVTNTIPNTGVTLPFISYGGTSILFLLAEMGLVLSVSRGIKVQ